MTRTPLAAVTLTWTESGKGDTEESAHSRYFESPVVPYTMPDGAAMKDAKGRVIGGYAVISNDGRTVFLRIWTTRDGTTFGAIPPGVTCVSLESAKLLAEKKIAQAQKRFAAKVTKGVGRQFAKAAQS